MTTTLAKVFGVVFVLVAILGFVQGDSILGIFDVNLAHNLVHLVIGLALLAVSGTESGARAGLKVFGVIYLLVAVLGFYVGAGELLGVVLVNQADNWLHAVLGVILVVASMGGSGVASTPAQPMGGGMGQA